MHLPTPSPQPSPSGCNLCWGPLLIVLAASDISGRAQQRCYPAGPPFLQVRRAASHAFRSIIFITITVTVMVIVITVTAITIVTISVAVAVVVTVIVIVIVVTVLLSP